MVVEGAKQRSAVVFGACLVALACGGDDGGREDPTLATTSATATTTATSTSAGPGPGTDDGPMATTADTGPGATTDVTTTGVDSSGTDAGDTGIPRNCGDGNRDPDEACDDGNQTDADGCNVDCTVSGSVLWSHSQAGGMGANEDGYGVAVADDGAAFVAGTLNGASADFFVRGYDPDGGLDWTATVDGSGAGTDLAYGLVRSGDQLYAAGQRNQGSNDVFVANYGLDGAAGWTAAFNDPINGTDRAHAVTADLMGNVGVAGDQAADLQGANVFVRVYDPAGGTAWSASYASAGTGADRAHGIAADDTGNFVVVGYETSGSQRDMWIRKYDPAGSPLWTQGFAGLDGLDDQAMAVTTDAVGDVYVAGFESTMAGPTIAWLRRMDLNGNEIWTQTYPGSAAEGAQALGVAVDDAGDVTIVGFERVGGFDRIMLRKYDSAGGMKWTETIDGAMDTSSYGRAITVGPDQHLWIAGGVDLGVDGRDVFIAKIGR